MAEIDGHFILHEFLVSKEDGETANYNPRLPYNAFIACNWNSMSFLHPDLIHENWPKRAATDSNTIALVIWYKIHCPHAMVEDVMRHGEMDWFFLYDMRDQQQAKRFQRQMLRALIHNLESQGQIHMQHELRNNLHYTLTPPAIENSMYVDQAARIPR